VGDTAAAGDKAEGATPRRDMIDVRSFMRAKNDG